MKTFIVFVGLLIINVGFLIYQGDCVRYSHEQTLLKAVAEECAAGAALLLVEDEYSNGLVVFDQSEGRRYADEHLEYSLVHNAAQPWSSRICVLEFEDDYMGYPAENKDKIPAVTAKIRVQGEDVFRLPFLYKGSIERLARYELADVQK